LAPTSRVTRGSARKPDPMAGALAAGFVLLLLATELVLSLPDETDDPSFVASFYATHRTLIIILQLLGFLAAVLLAAYAWRLRSVDRVVAVTGLVMAVCGLAPGFITLVIAVVADPDEPVPAGTWNMLEPRGDDILFLGIVVFAAAVAVRLGRRLPTLGLLALFVAISCLTRLVLEIAGKSRDALDPVGPLSFLLLIAVMAVLSFRGILGADSASQREPDDAYDRVDDRER
jgi:uncharacterized membrane protein